MGTKKVKKKKNHQKITKYQSSKLNKQFETWGQVLKEMRVSFRFFSADGKNR